MKLKLFKAGVALVVVVSVLWASGIAPAAYNLIMQSGVGLTRRSTVNFTGPGVNCVDNVGMARTDCTVASGAVTVTGVGGPNYSKAFVATNSLTITNVEHNFGHDKLLVSCYDNSAPPKFIEPAQVTIDSASFQIDVTFVGNPTGYCVVNGGAGTGCAVYTITSANAAFIVNAAATDVALFTLPQYGKVQGVTIKHSVVFGDGAGPMTDVTASVGDGTVPYTQFSAGGSIGEATPVADTAFYDAGGFKSLTMAAAGGSVSAHFTSVGRNFGTGAATNLTGGTVAVWVCSLRVQ